MCLTCALSCARSSFWLCRAHNVKPDVPRVPFASNDPVNPGNPVLAQARPAPATLTLSDTLLHGAIEGQYPGQCIDGHHAVDSRMEAPDDTAHMLQLAVLAALVSPKVASAAAQAGLQKLLQPPQSRSRAC